MVAFQGPLTSLLQPQQPLEVAVHNGSLGVSYSVGGFLFLYYIGVSKTLQQLGIVHPGSVRTAGASIGAVAQLVDHPGSWGHDEFMARAGEVFDSCRAERNCLQLLDARIAQFASPLVERTWAGANGRACMSISLADEGPDAKGASVCSYSGPDDLLSAARAACYMPGWSGVASALPFRGRKVMDGGLTQSNPCPPGVTYCIKVEVLTPWDLARTAEGLPASLPRTAALLADLTTKSIAPDPAAFAAAFNLQGQSPPGEGAAQARMDWGAHMPGSKTVADIYPGRYTKSPLTSEQMHVLAFVPGDADARRTLYEMGQADVRAWARAQGWPGA